MRTKILCVGAHGRLLRMQSQAVSSDGERDARQMTPLGDVAAEACVCVLDRMCSKKKIYI